MELNFTVTNQRIKYVSNLYIVEKSRNYLTAKFSFSGSEWKNVAKTAIFKKDDNVINVLLDENGRCTVPWELITRGTLKVSVFGGDLVTVDTAEVKILKSGYEEGNAPSEPTSDVYAQILAELQSIRDDFITEEMLGQAVEDWLAENVVEALSPADVEKIVYDYLDEHKDELKGEKGAVFTPHVSDEGVMSWTNDGGLENPPPVDLKINVGSEYALLTEAGYSIVASIDEYYVLTVVLKNKAGDVLSTSEPIDLPIESMIINVDYDEESGILTFSLQNGQTLDVNISTLVRGLVPTSRKIAGVDLEDDITTDELKTVLNIISLENDVEDLKTRIDEGLKEIEIPEEQLRIGGIANNTGADNNASILINIIPYLNSFYQIITCDEGYGYRIYAYNVDGSYNGYLIDGMELSKEPAGYGYFTDLTDLNQVRIKYPNYLFKLSMYKLDNSEATLDMINHLHVFSNILEKSDYVSVSELDDVKSSIASVSDEVDAVEEKVGKLKYEWTANIKGATWQRLCYLSKLNKYGTNYLIHIEINRSDVLVKDTFFVEATAKNFATIVKVSGNNYKYNSPYSVRVVLDGTGSGYFEIYDDMKGATSDTYTSVYCTLIPLSFENVVTFDKSTDGTTVPSNYSVSATMEVKPSSFQSDVTDAINSRLAYKDISSSIDVGDTGCTASAYVENGQVIIQIVVPAGSHPSTLTIDSAYAPRLMIAGSFAPGQSVDRGSVDIMWINSSGTIYIGYAKELTAKGYVTFTYPLKSS